MRRELWAKERRVIYGGRKVVLQVLLLWWKHSLRLSQRSTPSLKMKWGGGVVLRACLVHGAARRVERLYSCSEISWYRKLVPV